MIDPEVAALLDELIAAARPSSMSLPLPQGRRNFVELFNSLSSTPPIGAVHDVAIAGPGGPLPLRIYSPAEDGVARRTRRPILLAFHGGGWVFGDVETADALCRGLANASGCIVVSVGYRLAPERPFPAALDDADTALRWTRDHGAEVGASPDRIAVGGESSGGNLAAALALRARDRGDRAIRFQLLLYPALDATMSMASYRDNADDPFLSASEMRWYWARYLGDDPGAATDPYASPTAATSLEGVPPAHVITAGDDVLRDEGEAYARRLVQAGVPASVRRYEGVPHGFMSMDGKLSAGARAIADAGVVLREAFDASMIGVLHGHDDEPERVDG
jgi:acetyl esterase/lipase